MASFTRFFSSIKSAYNTINPSTLTGAIDVIVVKQEDGSLRCTPFHVRFGKLGVLQNQNNKVYITINGTAVEDLYMELGGAGEAVFIEEDSIVPTQRHLEPSDSNIFLDPDNALLTDSHPQLSNIDCSPQIINKQIDEQKAHENHETPPIYAYEQSNDSNIDVDVLNSNTTVNNRRHTKRRSIMKNTRKQSSEDDYDQEVEKAFSPTKRQSRAKARDSTPTSLNEIPTNHMNDDESKTNLSLQRKRSASESDLAFFPIDDDKQSESSTPFVDAHSRMNSIDSRKKVLIIPPRKSPELDTDEDGEDDDDDDDNESYTSSPEESLLDDVNHMKTTRTLSNPIPIEVKSTVNNQDEEQNTLISPIFSQSAPLTNNINIPSTRMSQSNTNDSYYLNESFSPNSSFEIDSSVPLRPSSPKSDTEYELDKSSAQQKTITSRTGLGWHWKWGELPERKHSVFRYFWPSSSSATQQQTKPTEGVYLDDITNIDRSKYLPTIDIPQRSIIDDDQESGKGNSVPHSPVLENENPYLLHDVQLSLCGNLNNPSGITDELFYRHLVPYEKFVSDGSIVNNPDLVVRIGGKYYNWAVGSTLIASTSIYQKQLPVEIIEQLQNKPMTPTKTRSSVWWFFSGKKADISSDGAKSDALAQVAKSEMAETVRHNQNFIRNNSESDDNEVESFTNNIQEQQTMNSTQKKTMILSSDQLKRLNLKPGMNQVEFSVTTALQGTTIIGANIFFFDHTTKFVISDIDGTITKSDVFGHILPLVGKDWSHDGIAEFFQAIQKNGYQFIYLSARAIGQSRVTRNFLKNIKQCGCALPNGPLLISPDTLVTALYREVIAKRPEDFKIECLKNIASLFPNKNPFYAGFGNRINDQWAYTAVGIPVTRIFTINPRGEVVRQKISQVLSTSYKNLHEVVDHVFPTMDMFSASEDHSTFKTWLIEPNLNLYENDMLQDLEELSKQQKSVKGKVPLTPTLSGTTPTTTVTKPGGEKVLTLAQATENTVKKP